MTRMPWDITREMFLSIEEIQTLLQAVRPVATTAPHIDPGAAVDQVVIEGLLWSGLRSSEFCRLRVKDVLNTEGKPAFRVHHAPKPDRLVYLPSQLHDLVSHYVDKIRPSLLPHDVPRGDTNQPLVFHERRRPYERTGLYRRVVRILSEAGLGNRASVQLLRHSYGYLAYLRTGGNLLFVQRQLGHAHPMITSIYAQFIDEDYADFSNRVSDFEQ